MKNKQSRLAKGGSCLSSPNGSWWSQGESNPRPRECHSRALPTELWPQRDWKRQPRLEHRRAVAAVETLGLLLGFGRIADDVGDVFVAFVLFLDEGRIVLVGGLFDLAILVDHLDLAALSLGVGLLKRDEFGLRCRNRRALGVLGSRRAGGCGSRRTGRRRGGSVGARPRDRHDHFEHRAAFRADDRVFAQVVEFRSATGAETLGAELGFGHG